MQIVVTMSAIEIEQLDQPVHYGMTLLQKLRKRGIPAIGRFCLVGVVSGSITLHTAANGDCVYTYNAPDEDDEL